MLNTTIGQLLVNDSLPEELRDWNRVLDKKGMHKLLEQVARDYPEKYREISFKLNQIGQRAAQDQGGMSFSGRHLKRSHVANETRNRIQRELAQVLDDDRLTDQQRANSIVRIVGKEMEPQQKAILEEAVKNKNPLAMQVLSGSRGKPMNLASLLGGDMLYSDHRDDVIPIPVLRSYSEGLTPEEYWAGTYGARRGIIATKFATQDAGFLSKQLNQAGHRLVVIDEEGDADPNRGMIVETDDLDNEGALLSQDAGPYKRNTPLTPKILKHLKRLGKNRILVRSPLVGGSPEGGVYARDVGIRETGKLPGRGEQVGLQAAQALSEPISQGQLSAKHSGGVAGQEKAVGGFQAINQLIQVPKKLRGGAAHSEQDGTVQHIEEAPAGGHYVTINGKQHYVGDGYELKVKKGDEVEAGDLLSDGIPNPALIVKHKGVGEGRRYFVNEFRKAMAGSGMYGHRRNIELLARGLINHVRMTDETDDHAPDDIIPYSTLEHTYKPREDHQVLTPKKAIGQYLERPVLHYSIGTKVRPSMLKDFEEFGILELPVHADPPPFEPHMVRGMYQLQHDPDWMTQMYGSGLQKSLLNSTARGATSDARGTSFVSSLADGTDFGEDPDRAVIRPQVSYELPETENKLTPELPTPDSAPDLSLPKPRSSGSMFFGGRFKLGQYMKQAAEESSSPSAMSPSVMPSGASPLKVTPSPDAGSVAPASIPAPAPAPAPIQAPAPAQAPSPIQASAPAPATAAQVRTDRVQQSRSYGPSDILADTQTLFSGALPMRNLAGNDMASNMNRQSARDLGIAAARQSSNQVQMEQAATSNQQTQQPAVTASQLTQPPGMPRRIQESIDRMSAGSSEIVPDQFEVPEEVTINRAGQGNSIDDPLNNPNFMARSAVAGRLGAAAVKRRIAQGVSGEVVKRGIIPGATRLATNYLLPGARLGTAAAGTGAAATAAAGTGVLGTAAALPGVVAAGGLTLTNAATELLDAGGVLPEWAGGTGMGNFGWDQQSFDRATTQNGYLSAAGRTFMNPLKGVTSAGTGAVEALGAGASKVRDIVTNSTPESRNAATQRAELEAMGKAEREQLSAHKSELERVLSSKSISPVHRDQLQQQQQELEAKLQDSIDYSAAMQDETADWELGKQNTFGGGHYFRDAIGGTQARLEARIRAVEQQGNLTPQQLVDLENMKQRRDEAARLKQLYNREVGYFSEGDFAKVVSQQVQNTKQQVVAIRQRMREPAVMQDKKLMSQLMADYRHHEQRLTNFRSWAEQAKSQTIRQ